MRRKAGTSTLGVHACPTRASGDLSAAWRSCSGGVSSLSLRPDGKLLAAGGWDKRVRVWQTRKWKPLAVLRQHNGTVNAVDFSSCSRWLASASNDHTIALWSLYPP
mmetsp:Transcript_54986/g.97077  ORF Transcript_54986/g.97077 Transcript_54986/m.97077 type:complete len:106 (-) Transcript_54986:184-501(-)